MNTGRSLLSSPSPPLHSRSHFKNTIFSSSCSSVPMLYENKGRGVTSVPTPSTMCHFPPSRLSEEQLGDYKDGFSFRGEKVALVSLEQRLVVKEKCIDECEEHEFEHYRTNAERQPLCQPVLWQAPTNGEENPTWIMPTKLAAHDSNLTEDHEEMKPDNSLEFLAPSDALSLAKMAMITTRKAALVGEKSIILATKLDEPQIRRMDPKDSYKEILRKEEPIVRSKRLLERRSKKRKNLKTTGVVRYSFANTKKKEKAKKIDQGRDPNDLFKLFFWVPETKQLLTTKEAKYLFSQIQDLMKLEEVKHKLQAQFDREPTMAEWAQSVGMSRQALQSCIKSGKRSRAKMFYRNYRLVVHIAKQYEGHGLDIQDLLQEGSKGLMRSFEKFKPRGGCKFSTYAYWWIRQSIRKFIFQNSRTIQLPENVFARLKKVKIARRLCIQEGQPPNNQEIARHVGVTTKKLENLLLVSKKPQSINKRAWSDHNITYQETIADHEVEIPELGVSKAMMRQHVRDFLGLLDPRERKIIEYRFGICGGTKTLTEVGDMFGLSKERIRQLQTRALNKLKMNVPAQGIELYTQLLT